LVPTRKAVDSGGFVTLGSATTFWNVNKPGLIMKETAECKMVWSVAMPLPANLLRELCRYGGSSIWCEEDDVVLASDTVAALHSVKSGPRTLHLPSPRIVQSALTGRKIGKGAVREVKFEVNAPETRIFRLM
jgi:hypothetical protein